MAATTAIGSERESAIGSTIPLSHGHVTALLAHGRQTQGPQGRRPQAHSLLRERVRPRKGHQERPYCENTGQQGRP